MSGESCAWSKQARTALLLLLAARAVSKRAPLQMQLGIMAKWKQIHKDDTKIMQLLIIAKWKHTYKVFNSV
uniref:Secreted protein n=1 Tax=Arundo donax TaxID=35708 RepID=A0A0A9H9P6_ARUDO